MSSSSEREPSPERPGEALERLPYDRSSHDVARTRRVAIGVVVIGAAVLAALARAWWAYGLALASLLAVRFWAQRVTAASDEQRALEGRALALDAEGVSVPRRDAETRVAWRDLERVEIDHDRLLVILRVRGGGEVEVEPSFGGLGLDGLARRIEEARSHARG